jgi:hypothetical protein
VYGVVHIFFFCAFQNIIDMYGHVNKGPAVPAIVAEYATEYSHCGFAALQKGCKYSGVLLSTENKVAAHVHRVLKEGNGMYYSHT